jgi:hypothetical protein
MRALKNMKPLSFIATIMTFSFLGFSHSVPEPSGSSLILFFMQELNSRRCAKVALYCDVRISFN